MRHQRLNTVTTTLLLALAYFATGRLGLMLPAFGSNITLIWLPTGIAVAALLRWGSGCWPGISLGAFAVNAAVGTPWTVALGIALGNTLGPLLAAWILRRTGFHPAFDRKRDILLLAAAAIPGMLVSASLGAAVLALAAMLPKGALAAWLIWWAGDTTGVIAAAPLVFTMTREEGRAILHRRAEFVIWLSATAVAAWGVFVFNRGSDGHAWALAFLPLPLVAWAALRFGAVGTSLALITLSVGAAYGTATGHGPFFRANPIEGTAVLWIFMATSAVLGWLITALHAARVQAAGIQRLFEQALSDVSLGVLLAGLDRRITYVNQGFTRLAGYAEAELLGKSCAILQGPETDPAMVEKLKLALHGDGSFDGEILNYCKDGTTFWNALLISPVRDESGAMTGFLGIQRDITKRKRAELALHESEERLRLAMSAASQGLYDLNVQTGDCIVSPEYALMLGYDPAEFRETNAAWRERLHPDDRETVYGIFSEYVAGRREEYRVEFRQRTGDGGWKWILSLGRLVAHSADGQPLRMLGTHTDITERKRAEETLRESEERFRRIIDHAPEAISLLDAATGRFVQVNPAAERLFKRSAAELCRVGPLELSPPSQPDGRPSGERAPEFVARAMAGETPVFEWTHRDAEGRDIPCEVRLLRLEIGGRPIVRGSITDITERKRLEQEREQYLKFFRLSTEAMCIADPFGCFKQVNPAFMRLTGFTESELLTKPFLDFVLPEDRQKTADKMKLQAAILPSLQFENRYVCKEGAVILLSWTAIFDKNDGVTYATARDITKLRQAELALRDSEFRWKFAIEGSGDGLWDWDVTAGTVFFSKRWKETLGYAEDEIGNRFSEWETRVHLEDQARAMADVRAHLEGATTHFVNEHRVRCKDGSWKWILAHGLTVSRDAGGRPLRMIGTHSDITARRQAEIEREALDRKVQETQKLESLGVLAGGIAHDFNNLLTSVLGNASIAAMELPPGSSVQDCIAQITEASLRAADLCKQMLAYSGRGRFVVQKLDLGQLVEQTAQMLQISISKKAVLRFRLEKGLPPVEVDATQIRQVIMNLVINASEAIGDRSGVISLSTGLTRVDRNYLHGTLMDPDLPEGEYVCLEVADSGCGMNSETQARIFDPFFTTKFTGRGLGLAAVLGIVRGHKGALKVHSAVGRGTTFKLVFPAAAGDTESPKTPPATVPQWHSEGAVLVVDDEETMRSTDARMLPMMGLEPVLAVDGREAIAVFRENPARFVLVLLDLTMPHMDGEQTFSELRRLRPDVRVVLMSGFNAQEALVPFEGKGLASFLQKPFTLPELRAVLKSVMG